MIEHINVINSYYAQIAALLDLMMMCENSVDIQSIKTASEMSLTMLDDLKNEVDAIELEWRDYEKAKTKQESSTEQRSKGMA